MYVTRSGGKVEYKAKDGMNLYQGDSVRTGKNSSVKINFGDGDATTLGENTKITIAQFSNNIEELVKKDFSILAVSKGKKVAVKQESGKTWTKVKNLLDLSKRHKVETSTAVMGVRGTLFLTEVAANGQVAVTVFDGQVGVNQDRASEGNEQAINPGQRHSSTGTNYQSKPINFRNLFNQIEQELVRVIIEDTITEAEEAVQVAEKMMEGFINNQEEKELAVKSIQSLSYAELLAVIVEKMVEGAKLSSKSGILFELSFIDLSQKVNQIIESTQELRQQVNQTIEQFNLPENIKQELAVYQKLMEEVIIENTYLIPIPTSSDNNDRDTGSTPAPTPEGNPGEDPGGNPGEDPGGNPGGDPGDNPGGDPGGNPEPPPLGAKQIAPWFVNNAGEILITPFSRTEVIDLREELEDSDILGGLSIKINDDFISNSQFDFAKIAVRLNDGPQIYTMDQLELKTGEQTFNKGEIETDIVFPLRQEHAQLDWITVIFYDDDENPIGYYQQQINTQIYYDNQPGFVGKSYKIFINGWTGNMIRLDLTSLTWTAPLEGNVSNYEIYDKNENLLNSISCSDDICSFNNVEYVAGNFSTILSDKTFSIVAVFADDTRSNPLEIEVDYSSYYKNWVESWGDKLASFTPEWITDNGGDIIGITYSIDPTISFDRIEIPSNIQNIFGQMIFYNDEEKEIAKKKAPFKFSNYLYLSSVAKIEGYFNTPISSSANINDYKFAARGIVSNVFSEFVEELQIESNQVTLQLAEPIVTNASKNPWYPLNSGYPIILETFVNGVPTQGVFSGNSITINGLEPNRYYQVLVKVQLRVYFLSYPGGNYGSYDLVMTDEVTFTTNSQ